jgi:hypothetical protein
MMQLAEGEGEFHILEMPYLGVFKGSVNELEVKGLGWVTGPLAQTLKVEPGSPFQQERLHSKRRFVVRQVFCSQLELPCKSSRGAIRA